MAGKPTKPKAFKKAKPAKTGRPCKLTPEIQEKISEYLANGCYLETAAACAGIVKNTLYDWMRIAAKDNEEGKQTKFTSFSDAVEKAMAEAEMKDINRIEDAAKKNWFAAAWRLERRNPKRWALAKRPDEVDDDNKPTTNITLNYSLKSHKKGGNSNGGNP